MKIFNYFKSNALLVMVFASILIGCKKEDTSLTGSMTDLEGNVYKTIKIGNQTWMAEDLQTTFYRNGDSMIQARPWLGDFILSKLNVGAYVVMTEPYGMMYNWDAVSDNRNIAPIGWHVPSSAEWESLITFLGGMDVAGGKMKELGTLHWANPNTGATNESGLNVVPSGLINAEGIPSRAFSYNYFWSDTESSIDNVWCFMQDYSSSRCQRVEIRKHYVLPLRLVKD